MIDPVARLNAALKGRYAIERELGAGGMATVYLAEDLKHHRKVAVKVLRPELAAVVGAERFLKEIEVTANLQHPNILPLYDSGEADTFLYYVMPYIEGETLRAKLNREKQLAVGEAVEIAKSVAGALSFAHARGVIHRDIKPENILLQSGQALVADFGIALAINQAAGTRLTETGLSLGTPYYMSPEQATGDRDLDPRSDVYSLGAVVYEMLVGDPPFLGSNLQAVIAKVVTDTPTAVRVLRESVPASVDSAVAHALAKVPADRFATAMDFAVALTKEDGQVDPGAGAGFARKIHALRMVPTLLVASGLGLALVGAFVIPRLQSASAGSQVEERESLRSSIAVLPFRDMSPNGDQAWFGEGLADEIMSALTRLPGLRVVARTSSFSLRDSPIATIGDSLAVGTVLEGSVRRDGDQMRIEARLVNVADESSLWSQSFRTQLTSVFDVQDSIARSVVTALQVELGTFSVSSLAFAATADPAAHEQYLRGRFRWNQRNEAGLLAALEHFHRAVELDSSYAAAWAGLGDTYLVLPEYSPTASPEVMLRESEAALAQALRLDPDLPEALTTAAWGRLIHHYDWTGAEDLLGQALAADSTSVGALHWMSHVLSWQGRHEEAVMWASRAVEVDPLSPILHSNLGYILMDAGDYEAAIAAVQSAIALDPGFGTARQTLWESNVRAGRWEEAAELWKEWAAATGRDSAAAERVAEAIAMGADGTARSPPPRDIVDRLQLGSQHLGNVLAIVGDHEGALDALERAFLERSGSRSVLSMKVNPVYDPLRDESRFKALLQRVGLDR